MAPKVRGWAPKATNEYESTQSLATSSRSATPSSISSVDETYRDRPPRKGDPDWVARPRNAFIIFRCEFAKHNARGAQASGSGGQRRGPSGDETMSSRAGRAWRALSEVEHRYYRDLAVEEKIKHEEAHPGYRYRPARKRNTTNRHQPYWTPVGRPSKKATRRLRSHRQSEDDDYASSSVASAAKITPKTLRRLSTSVPPLPPLILTQEERKSMRRTESDLLSSENAESSSNPNSPFSSYELVYPSEHQHSNQPSPLNLGSPTPTTSAFPSKIYHTSTLGTVASGSSSLANWNGGMPMAAPAERTYSSFPSSSTWPSPSTSYHYMTHQASFERPRGVPTYYSHSPQTYWNASQGSHIGPDVSILHQYYCDYASLVPHTPEDYLLYDIPGTEEQKIFDGYIQY